MSTWTALILCMGAGCVGFLLASCLAAGSFGDDIAETWQEGREYGHAEVEAARARAVELRPVTELRVVDDPPFDWDAAERDQAKAKHPSTWAEGHADRGPWPA
jgi:hypothetical protein